ncbi:hypothetical protein BG28_00240 [Nesterenkonia sp. AN1]|uniref:Major facilitator superfamily (MFS) profile domain-containing protein n=1 Tax=Nesterenkonia aurantiaca TaxID=1436010 RepID=A0A4R7G254_9MICC|nr:hypothetical protein [Nesterenkonia]EXF26287.1 hypothetical protein BG28_00240 [Nesterenkonia sp. AN1]TDS85383.1 hypothetical protein EV640_10629 [Nesterenkonia aurantiaca]
MGGIMLMIGGTIGAVLYGVFASRWDVRRVQAVFAVGSGVMFIVFINATAWLPAALVAGVLLGMIINGCISGIYTIAPMTYAPRLRYTAAGLIVALAAVVVLRISLHQRTASELRAEALAVRD